MKAKGPKNLESTKIWADYLKHLTTLSTGSIILLATFLEKLFTQPEWKYAVVVALLGFLGCVLGSVLSFTSIAIGSIFWEDGEDPAPWVDTAGGIALFMAWIGFCVGIISLTIFAIKNLV
jgi:hypothetical protein